MPPRQYIRRRRDRGFSLIVVFLLVMVMVGVAAQVLLSTQEDMAVSGQDRESLTSFYAAEYGVAQAKDWIEKQAMTLYPTSTSFTNWTLLLQVLATDTTHSCLYSPLLVPTKPITARMGWQDFNMQNGTASPSGTVVPYVLGMPKSMWKYCIHNNTDDPAYLDSNHNSGAPCNNNSGDLCDGRDKLNYLTVDAWGAFPVDSSTSVPLPGASLTHLAINIGPPTTRTITGVGNCSYSVEGGCSSHVSNGGVVDTTSVQTTTGSVR